MQDTGSWMPMQDPGSRRPLQDTGSQLPEQDSGSRLTMQRLGPWGLLGVNYLGNIRISFGALFIWGLRGSFGVQFYLFGAPGAHVGPILVKAFWH